MKKANTPLPFETLCREYAAWTNSPDYNEGYKWEFQEKFDRTFASVSNSEDFKQQYFELLSYNENFQPYLIQHGGRTMMKDLFTNYPQIHVQAFHELFDEEIPLEQRIRDFVDKIDALRKKAGSRLKITYIVPAFFLFVYDHTKYPLASVNGFIKDYFEYMGVEDAQQLRGLDLYLFYFEYIKTTLIPLLRKHLRAYCSAIDAQDFCWFVARWICDGYRASKQANLSAYQPRLTKAVQSETEYNEDVDKVSLTTTDRKNLTKISTNPPTRAEVNQLKYRRNIKMAKLALENAHFACEANCQNHTFISGASHKPYMEAHHLIPIPFSDLYYDRYHVSLDRPENIISLCPMCHRIIHFGIDEDRNKILKELFQRRKKQLQTLGIDITFNDLLKHYKKLNR